MRAKSREFKDLGVKGSLTRVRLVDRCFGETIPAIRFGKRFPGIRSEINGEINPRSILHTVRQVRPKYAAAQKSFFSLSVSFVLPVFPSYATSCAEYSITRRMLESLTLYSVDMSTTFDETRYELFCHAFCTPIYPQNFQIRKFAQRVDHYRALFISGMHFENYQLAFPQRSLK